ncbi:MAG: hypothetical protein EPN26_05870 [Rhodospirillales bacterium]|nr:MAG: hypothetical protein EPN26_05870 [Rhodospirillales bacterium]
MTLSPAIWQPVFDLHAGLFEALEENRSLAFLDKATWDAGKGEVLEGRLEGKRILVQAKAWSGAGDTKADLLFVGLRDSLTHLDKAVPQERLGLLKDRIHEGEVLFFVMKTKCTLIDAGWEDFLDSLGLAFMGACR